MMNKNYLLAMTLILFVMSWPLSATERHVETEGGFSYEVPADWQVIEFPALKFKIIVATPIDGFSLNMTLLDEKYKGSLAQYAQANIPLMQKSISDFKIVNQKSGQTLAGIAYRSLTYTQSTNSGVIIQTANFLELKAGQKLIMTCTSPKGHEARVELACNKVVRSLRVN